MNKKSWTLLLLIMVLIGTVMAGGIHQIINREQDGLAADAGSSIIPLAQWEYAWNDPPLTGGENDGAAWEDIISRSWRRTERPLNPEGRGGSNVLWLRARIPAGIGPKPYMRIQGTQLFEIYAEEELIFSHGRIDPSRFRYIGTPPRLVALPEGIEGQYLYIRVYSQSGDIGLLKKAVIDSRSGLLVDAVKQQSLRFVLGCFYFLTGLIALYPYIRLRQPYLISFAGFALSFGLYTVIRTSLVLVLWDNPEFWMIFELAALVLSMGFICAFTEQVLPLGQGKSGNVMSLLHFWYGGIMIPLAALHVVEGNTVLLLYQLLMLSSIIYALLHIGRIALRNNQNAQILLVGLVIFCTGGTIDIVRQMLMAGNSFPELAYWGGCFFLLSLVMVIIKNIHQMLHRLSNTEKLSVAGQMAAGVAHEIRNPVTVISGYLQLMKRESNQHKHVIKLMLGEVKRIELLVNEFLFLAKPSAPKCEPKQVELLTRDVLRLFEAQAADYSVQLTLNCPHELPLLSCDENQLKQVLVNVFKNGIEAMAESGGELAVSIEVKGAAVCITVSDAGCGIEETLVGKIGEPFFTTKENGNGLGIMICRRIIENHHGTFTISNNEGKGTTVEISLPLGG